MCLCWIDGIRIPFSWFISVIMLTISCIQHGIKEVRECLKLSHIKSYRILHRLIIPFLNPVIVKVNTFTIGTRHKFHINQVIHYSHSLIFISTTIKFWLECCWYNISGNWGLGTLGGMSVSGEEEVITDNCQSFVILSDEVGVSVIPQVTLSEQELPINMHNNYYKLKQCGHRNNKLNLN